MNVLLLHPPDTHEVTPGRPDDYGKQARSYLPPLGLLYVASHIEKRHNTKVVDMCASRLTAGDVESVIGASNPGLIGIGCVITQWPSVLKLAERIRQSRPDIPIVVGGPNPTLYPKETLASEAIDFVICGHGQAPLMELCDCLEQDKSTEGIKGCYSRDQVAAGTTPERVIGNLEAFSFPNRAALPIQQYNVPFCPENPCTSMISSMGCCYRCAYCQCRNNKPVQVRSSESVCAEMEEIANIGIRSILFQDDLFTVNSRRVCELCESILEKEIKLHWTIKSRADRVDEQMLSLLRRAGCFNVHLGIESGNDKTLLRMQKDITSQQVRDAVRMIKQAGLGCTGNFMLGYPGESESDVRNTIAFASELSLDVCQFAITLELPGTELYAEAVSSGKRKGDVYRDFVLDPLQVDIERLYASDRLGEDKLKALMREAYATSRTLYQVK
jgi:anaerobic magnesium-protoporphyrin IX monomethyl ester cyclase